MNPIVKDAIRGIEKFMPLKASHKIYIETYLEEAMHRVAYGCRTNPNFNLNRATKVDENSYVPKYQSILKYYKEKTEKITDLTAILKNPEIAKNITLAIKGNDLLNFASTLAESLKVEPTPAQPPEELLTTDEAADFLKVSRVTLWAWQKNNILVPLKIGQLTRYRKSDILAAMEKKQELTKAKKTTDGGK